MDSGQKSVTVNLPLKKAHVHIKMKMDFAGCKWSVGKEFCPKYARNFPVFMHIPVSYTHLQKIQETVSSLSKQVRMRPTRSQLESLQKQIQDGTYQPSATEIAARMLMIYDQED